MRKGLGLLFATLLASLVVPVGASAELKAGAQVEDMTWHVGASAGQYASGRQDDLPHWDPNFHQFKNAPSYGVQSRLSARAVVVEDTTTNKIFALVKQDLYLPQDLLWRYTAQLIAADPEIKGRINQSNLVMTATHNHSSPYYSSTAWGAWTFQDVFDVRSYSYYARQMAKAVVGAYKKRVSARVSADAVPFDRTSRNSMGPDLANDGTPAGFPYQYFDRDMSVIRFEKAGGGDSIATLVNYSLHPEFLEGNNLISADYVGPFERMVDGSTGGVTIWTQGGVGSGEPERGEYQVGWEDYKTPVERLEFSHREYAQAEYGASLMARQALEIDGKLAKGEGSPRAVIDTTGPVDFKDKWFPGPATHPYPAVSNCRTNQALANPFDPKLPIAGLPDCAGPATAWREVGASGFMDYPRPPFDPGISSETLRKLGIPIPDNYGAISFTGLEEDVDIHLQAFRIGELLVTTCSCEQWADQSRNIKTRTDKIRDNEWLGYDWTREIQSDGLNYRHKVPLPRSTDSDDRKTATPDEIARMKQQVHNDAHGWNSAEYAPYAESEPTKEEQTRAEFPVQIKGNYTHDDNHQNSVDKGYTLTIPIGMANDYNGYIATYREFQRGDHYRKALTGWGPHSSDYMATRLVKLGRSMKNLPIEQFVDGSPDPDMVADTALEGKVVADLAQQEARAAALGKMADGLAQAYEAALPDDGGTNGKVVKQPDDLQRFGLASMVWEGGNNYVDNPVVVVERKGANGTWRQYADQQAEVQTTLKFPGFDGAPDYFQGKQTWQWTAHWEVFTGREQLAHGDRTTPPGTYRFRVAGFRREGRATKPYAISSRAFEVTPWTGITVEGLAADDGRVRFRVGPSGSHETFTAPFKRDKPKVLAVGPIDYPNTYKNAERAQPYISEHWWRVTDELLFCLRCGFRTWLDAGDASEATVTFASATRQRRVPAERVGPGSFRTNARLADDEVAYVCPGDVQDPFGNVNGQLSRVAGDGTVNLDCSPIASEPAPGPKGNGGNSGNTGVDATSDGRGQDSGTPTKGTSDDTPSFNELNQAAGLGLPVPSASKPGCIGKRSLKIKVQTPYKKVKVRSASILVDGKTVKRLKGGKRTVTLKKLPSGTVTVTVKVRGSDGRLYAASRRYKTCAK